MDTHVEQVVGVSGAVSLVEARVGDGARPPPRRLLRRGGGLTSRRRFVVSATSRIDLEDSSDVHHLFLIGGVEVLRVRASEERRVAPAELLWRNVDVSLVAAPLTVRSPGAISSARSPPRCDPCGERSET